MKRAILYIQFAFLLACTVFSQNVFADVKIKSRQTMQGQTYESTTYIKGKRQRSERAIGGSSMVDIMQCDLKRNLRVVPQTRTYMVDAWETGAATTTQNASDKSANRNPQTAAQKGGVVTITYTTKDTGERKQMFGYTARRITTTIETESSLEACTPVKNKMQTDGWYIDAAFALDCQMERYQNYRPESNKPDCQDRYVTKNVGTAKRGYPVWEKMTMFDDAGKESYSMINEVIELSNATLEASLFDVPSDYREVKSAQELYTSAAAMNNSSRDDDEDKPSNASNPVKNMPPSTPKAATTIGAKKPGVIRIGLAQVKTGAVGDAMNAEQLSSAIGSSLAENLKAPNIEVIQLEARVTSLVDAEAKQKECDFVIYATASHKKGGGGFGGMLGKAAGNVLGSAVPVTDNVGAAVAVSGIYTAAAVSQSVKSKDEITLDIKLNQPGNANAAFAKQYKAKAKSNGEDIISPLIKQAATEIMSAAASK